MIIDDFLLHLKDDRGMSENTREAYRRDIENFREYLESDKIRLNEASNTNVVAYLLELKNKGKSKATINRRLASIRSFYRYLYAKGLVNHNPTEDIKSPRIFRKPEVEYISVEETLTLLNTPDDSIKGKRDKAILELLYATGIRVSELIELRLSDFNVKMGFVSCNGKHGKARIVPVGNPAREAMEDYLKNSRKALIRSESADEPDSILFVNYMVEAFTRQGFWKILKAYGDKAGLSGRITPQTLRNSFAMHMVANGIDMRSLQELMGHEDITATQIYFGNTKNKIKEIYDKTHPRAK